MAGITIDIDVSEVLAALRRFERFSTGSLMETLGTLVEGQTKRRIAAEKTGPDGKRWKALSPLTVKARTNKSNSPLNDTGTLMGRISHTATARTAIVGTNVKYAAFHQFGVASIKPKKGKALAVPLAGGGFARLKESSIPARPFLGISAQNMAEIRAACDAWLARQVA